MSHGLLEEEDGGCAELKAGLAAGAIEGMMGVLLATSPRALSRGNANVSSPGSTGAALVALSMSFIWSASASFN